MTDFSYTSKMNSLISGIRDVLRDSGNVADDINKIMLDLDQIRKMKDSEKNRKSKGEEELNGKKGTIYDARRIRLLNNFLDLKYEYWNNNYSFVSWEELFSKTDKIDIILNNLEKNQEKFEDILLRSADIKTELDNIYKSIK